MSHRYALKQQQWMNKYDDDEEEEEDEPQQWDSSTNMEMTDTVQSHDVIIDEIASQMSHNIKTEDNNEILMDHCYQAPPIEVITTSSAAGTYIELLATIAAVLPVIFPRLL